MGQMFVVGGAPPYCPTFHPPPSQPATTPLPTTRHAYLVVRHSSYYDAFTRHSSYCDGSHNRVATMTRLGSYLDVQVATRI